MRSTNRNATRFLLKRNLFIGVIVFAVVFFILPFWGLSHIPLQKEVYTEAMPYEDYSRSMTSLVSVSPMTDPLNLELMTAVYGGLGFLTAMMLMRHLFSRRQGLLHAALPDRRETDFLRRLIAYALLCVVPIVLNFLIYLVIVAANGLMGFVDWSVLMPKFGMLLLINLYGFAMGMLCSVLTGTYWAAILAGLVLVVGAEGMAFLWNNLAKLYLDTTVSTGFDTMLRSFFPTFSLYKGFYRPGRNAGPVPLFVLHSCTKFHMLKFFQFIISKKISIYKEKEKQPIKKKQRTPPKAKSSQNGFFRHPDRGRSVPS